MYANVTSSGMSDLICAMSAISSGLAIVRNQSRAGVKAAEDAPPQEVLNAALERLVRRRHGLPRRAERVDCVECLHLPASSAAARPRTPDARELTLNVFSSLMKCSGQGMSVTNSGSFAFALPFALGLGLGFATPLSAGAKTLRFLGARGLACTLSSSIAFESTLDDRPRAAGGGVASSIGTVEVEATGASRCEVSSPPPETPQLLSLINDMGALPVATWACARSFAFADHSLTGQRD